jgi:hypothetical protein
MVDYLHDLRIFRTKAIFEICTVFRDNMLIVRIFQPVDRVQNDCPRYV